MQFRQNASVYILDGKNVGRTDRVVLELQTTERNIPAGTVALKQGAKVIAADGKQVGTVERVLIAPQLDRVTHLVIAQGLLVKERRRVPIEWVSEVKEDELHLAVGSHTLDELGFMP